MIISIDSCNVLPYVLIQMSRCCWMWIDSGCINIAIKPLLRAITGFKSLDLQLGPITRMSAFNNQYCPRQKGYNAIRTFHSNGAQCSKLKRDKQKDKDWNAGAEGQYHPLLTLSCYIVLTSSVEVAGYPPKLQLTAVHTVGSVPPINHQSAKMIHPCHWYWVPESHTEETPTVAK